jgi:ParB/RepB/Spo0J family partition protein
MPKLETKPLSWFKTDPKQPRKQFDEPELRLMGGSLREKQLQPLLARPDGTIIAGERRYRAAMLVGLASLQVIVTDEPLTEAEVRAIQLTENIHRADLTGYEKWQACRELMELNPDWQGKDLAEHLHLDPSMVTRLMSPSQCVQAVQDALRDGKIGISVCYTISKLPPEEQPGLLALKLSGASRDELESHGRKKRAADKPAVRMSRVKIAMPEGMSMVISGNDLSMSEVVELLTETLKEARKAAEVYDVKTFQNMMRDQAKAS